MKSVSADFLTAAKATVRKPKAKVEVLWTDPVIVTANEAITTDVDHVSWHDPNVFDNVTTTPFKYFILDGSNDLSGDYYAAPGTEAEAIDNQFGWYTDDVADYEGDFVATPEIRVNFGDAPRAVNQIVVVGEPTLNQYPTEFDLAIYDSGDVELFSDTYNGTSATTSIDLTDEGITTAAYMILTLKSWSETDTMGKIVEFFGVITDTFYTDDIVSLNLLEEREIKNATVPYGNISSNEIDLELQNISIDRITGETVDDPFFPDNTDSYVHGSMTPNVRITAYYGFELDDESIEYTAIGTFWTNDWNVSESKFSVSTTARDRLALLKEVDFFQGEILNDYTLYEIAEYVLTRAKQTVPMSDLTWSIDSELSSFTVPYCWFGELNYYEVLAKIAEACRGQVYMSKDDVLIIESYTADEGA